MTGIPAMGGRDLELHMETPELLTTEEAARRLRVSASYLNKLRMNGGGPTFAKVGSRVFYQPQDLAAWVETRKTAAGPQADAAGPNVH